MDLCETSSEMLQSFTHDQQSLLGFAMLEFHESPALYNACFGGEFAILRWDQIMTSYATYTQKEVTLSGILLELDGILASIYWSRMLKNGSA